MPDALLTTKLFFPSVRPQLVSRTRLKDKINNGLHRKLTLVSAPAGFGKTTLIGDWISQVKLPVAWLSLDDEDNDPVRFIRYLIAALSKTEVFGPDFDISIFEIITETQAPPIENILALVINDLAESPNEVVLILDDYHLIESKQIHKALSFFLDNLPPQLHLFILTRVDPELPIVRLRARDELTELRAADLRFTSAEVGSFLNHVMRLELAEKEIKALEERTEGWITGLQMAAISMQGIEDVTGFVESFTGSHRYILDYLIEEVLDRQPVSVQEFMIRTSILDRLSGELCEALTGNHDSQSILEAIEHSNLFIIPLDNERVWYRYHPLFADLLKQRLKQINPIDIPVLLMKASQWFKREGLIFEAISYALKAEDYEYAANLIENQIEDIWGAGRHAAIQKWIKRIPADLLSSKPKLSIIHAWYLFVNGQQAGAELYLTHSERVLESESTQVSEFERINLRGRIAAIKAFIANYRGDMSGMLEYANYAISSLSDEDSTWRCLAVWVLGDYYLFLGDMENAHQFRLEALEISRKTNQNYLVLVSEMRRIETERLQGLLDKVLVRCNQLIEFTEQKGISKTVAAGWLSAVWGNVAAEKGDLQEGMDRILWGVELGDEGSRDLSFFAWINLYYLKTLFSLNDLLTAKNVIQSLENIFHEKDIPILARNQLDSWQARISLREGDLGAVSDWVTEKGLQVNGEISYFCECEYTVFARLLIVQGETQKAVDILTRLLKAAEEGGRTLNAIEYLVMLALAWDAGGEKARALSILERALALAEKRDIVSMFVDEGSPMTELLYEALSKDIAVEYIQKLLAAFPKENEELARLVKLETPEGEWIEPLSEREIEVLELIAQGLTNQDIGDRLYLSLNTVKVHTRNIYSKLGVNNRTQAVAQARTFGILAVD